MTAREDLDAGVRNALLRPPLVDPDTVERVLRRANRSLGRSLGRIEWAGSLEAYIRRSADLLLDGWTVDDGGPLEPPKPLFRAWYHAGQRSVALREIERRLWSEDRAAHATSRLSRPKRLPVYLNAIEAPATASVAARLAVYAAETAARKLEPRARAFAAEKYWRQRDEHWEQARAAASLPFLRQAGHCFAAGLYAGALLRRGTATRTILIARPQLRVRAGRLHAWDVPAVVWPDGSERWYWDGIPLDSAIVAARGQLTADLVATIPNQELRRLALERLGWERFLATADAQLRAQDDYGKLWSTRIRLDGEHVHLVEVVNATTEPDGTHRRYFLRVPPTARTAREAVGWTFGFETADDYILSAQS